MNSLKLKNSFLLLLTAFIWGIAFVVQDSGGDALGPFTFNCLRAFIGGIVLLPTIKILDRTGLTYMKPKTKKEKKTLIIGGISCGIALFIASNIQQLGLYFGASAGKAGFLTACYIIIVPILGLFFGKKCGLNIWIGVCFSLVGLYLLCIHGSFSLTFADTLLLLCALAFSIHILVVDHFSPLVDGIRLSCIQFWTSAICTSIPMFFVDMKHSIAGIMNCLHNLTSINNWILLLYAGVLSCGVAYTLQIVGQKGLHPTVASLLMSMESVFSVLAGWIILGQTMSAREIFGCIFIFVAIVLAQIPMKKKITL
jgi:drug/metabolite transporter (DMT)-like permease